MPPHGLGLKMGWSLVGFSFSICFICVPAILGQKFSRWFSVPILPLGVLCGYCRWFLQVGYTIGHFH